MAIDLKYSDNIKTLSGPEVLPLSGGSPQQLFIFLHGYGSNGEDLISLTPFFRKHFPNAQFISPDAPYQCEMSAFGYQWFSLLDHSEPAMRAGAEYVLPILDDFIDQQLERFMLKPRNLVLIGFSQGTMMSLYSALRRKKNIAAVVGFSGSLLGADFLDQDLQSKPPVCLIHGMDDNVVPFECMGKAEEILEQHNVVVESHSRPNLAHSIDEFGLQAAVSFLKKQLY
jgi:phospholipase/carboxylesterase